MRIEQLEKETGQENLATVTLSSCDLTDKLKQGRQLDFRGYVRTEKGSVSANCLTDTGASAESFVNTTYVKKHRLPMLPLAKPCRLRLADNKLAPDITHMARLQLTLGNHIEELWCLVTSLGAFNIILGMPWMERHDPHISFAERSLTLNSDYCMSNCLLHHQPSTIYSGPRKEPEKKFPKHIDLAEISAYAFIRMSEREENQTYAMWPEDFERLEDEPADGAQDGDRAPGFTTDVAAITPEDYEKFFQKMKKKPITPDELRTRVPKAYHK